MSGEVGTVEGIAAQWKPSAVWTDERRVSIGQDRTEAECSESGLCEDVWMRALEGDRGDLDGNGGCDVDRAISGHRGWWRESKGTQEGKLCGGEHLVVVVIGGIGHGLSLSGALFALSVNRTDV